MQAFHQALASSKHIVAVAGAGLSAASGIPTFRGAGGMWRKYNAMELATPEAFARDPSTVWQFYHMRREKALRCSPNAAHHAIARLSVPSIRNAIAPHSTFTLITQNVDGLSQRALDELQKELAIASEGVLRIESGMTVLDGVDDPVLIEMHGRLFDVKCARGRRGGCGHVELDFSSPICDALAGTENVMEEIEAGPNIPSILLPRCRGCGELARPGVVWFGERPQHLTTIDNILDTADMCLVVGTSSTVRASVRQPCLQ
ncbi:DHS-like NAD/FAD-binding domain-containing protein [Punctularia strigosozonata HHB-11173 SS5]|uniref:DHS-like NAD/FAD-binding domain-containing protein n=1 Tax=Punctularia strigosozonata (strain HHB-11173) TaxID=741275 RepID=UPI0004417A69|nr:DHS-like NAD/FAD-binding domain-containing protein [Punctularia strigosozonata HHB-11173 SS5]EIN10692.1 DHS-like NAD/FAD-binding domain-containing protein [Punctularia strigosozonata HHB-11173 SS5]